MILWNCVWTEWTPNYLAGNEIVWKEQMNCEMVQLRCFKRWYVLELNGEYMMELNGEYMMVI